MTEYTARCVLADSDRITAHRTPIRVVLTTFSGDSDGPGVFLPPAAARALARGILALADEIDGGEAKPAEPRRVKVGDKLRVTEDGLYDAEVDAGDVLTVAYVWQHGHGFRTAGEGWVFEDRHIGNGLEFVDDGDARYVVKVDDQPAASLIDPAREALLIRATELAPDPTSTSNVLRIAAYLAGE